MFITLALIAVGVEKQVDVTVHESLRRGAGKDAGHGVGTLMEGDCDVVKRLDIWIHLLLNILSAMLLGASNYCMQRLSAPTRAELDRAHAKFVWLNVGIPSVKNLLHISRYRVFLWSLLGISSIPLHLMYNSVIFQQLSGSRYDILGVKESLVSNTSFDMGAGHLGFGLDTKPIHEDSPKYLLEQEGSFESVFDLYAFGEVLWIRDRMYRLQKLDNAACIAAYSNPLQSRRGSVLLAGDYNGSEPGVPFQTLHKFYPLRSNPLAWLCGDSSPNTKPHPDVCNVTLVAERPDEWVVDGERVHYCLSLPREERCRLRYSLSIMVVVLLCNMVKVAAMILTVSSLNAPSLVTLGDAIASFLTHPDLSTSGLCTSQRSSFKNSEWSRIPKAKAWDSRSHRWGKSASRRRWSMCIILSTCGLMVAIAFLIEGLHGLQTSGVEDISMRALWNMGLGTVTSETIVQNNKISNLIGNVIVANLPQLILSFLYLTYNGLLTCNLMDHEWSQYSQVRRPLRVSLPEGQQTSTYWLELPYAYALPLLSGSALLHWLFSQSLFLVNITFYDYKDDETTEFLGLTKENVDASSRSFYNLGFSPMAIVFSVFVSLILLIGAGLNSLRRYPAGLPAGSSCSAVISAACHPPRNDTNASVKHVQWGVVEGTETCDHCSFTSHSVSFPVQGKTYQ
ncbi:MAG: hypothetical protein M1833_002750 [Piccolia ochrophora]|nr:MAG: hypothetical protein M1833_002750 [Piccolia ochrophora]